MSLIGTQPTGALQGVRITAVAHEGLTVTIDGKPGRLAIVDEDGNVITASPMVAREAEAVAHNCLRNLWKAQGHLRVLSEPLEVANG